MCGQSRLPLAGPVGLSRCLPAGWLSGLVRLLVPLGLPCSLVFLPCVAFVSLHLFRCPASLCGLFGSWPSSSWGLYRNC